MQARGNTFLGPPSLDFLDLGTGSESRASRCGKYGWYGPCFCTPRYGKFGTPGNRVKLNVPLASVSFASALPLLNRFLFLVMLNHEYSGAWS